MTTLYVDNIAPNLQSSVSIPGHVIQVVQAVKTDTASTSSNSNVDISGLSATITPSSTNNKILVCVDIQGSGWEGDSAFQLFDNSTGSYAITIKGDSNGGPSALFGGWTQNAETDHRWITKSMSAKYLHSPSVTSAITYKLTMNGGGSQTIYVNRAYNYGSAGNAPGVVSSITLMEIAG